MNAAGDRSWLRLVVCVGLIGLLAWPWWAVSVPELPLLQRLPLWCFFTATTAYLLDRVWRAGWRVAVLPIALAAGLGTGLSALLFDALTAITIGSACAAIVAYGLQWAWTVSVPFGPPRAASLFCYTLLGMAMPLSCMLMSVGLGLLWAHFGLDGPVYQGICLAGWAFGLAILTTGFLIGHRARARARFLLMLKTL